MNYNQSRIMKFYNQKPCMYNNHISNSLAMGMDISTYNVALSNPEPLYLKHIIGNAGLYLLATSKPRIKLSNAQFNLIEDVKSLFCIEGESITLEKLVMYCRIEQGDKLEFFADLVKQTCAKYTNFILLDHLNELKINKAYESGSKYNYAI